MARGIAGLPNPLTVAQYRYAARVKPFLFLGTRAENVAADDEYAAMLRGSGLAKVSLSRHRLESAPLGDIKLGHLSGILLGGGPFNVSDSDKSTVQLRVEHDLSTLVGRVIAADFPFLGACYGIGTLGVTGGGVVDRTFGEPVGAVRVRLTDEGRADPLFGALPDEFDAFVGHKEAITRLPQGAVSLATSDHCPVQAMRIGRHVYATQFHPELDAEGLCTRIDVYQRYGYFEPAEVTRLQAMARASQVTEPIRLLADFTARYGLEAAAR
jgi:GMP synthase (glutamine-hydrolysing)